MPLLQSYVTCAAHIYWAKNSMVTVPEMPEIAILSKFLRTNFLLLGCGIAYYSLCFPFLKLCFVSLLAPFENPFRQPNVHVFLQSG